MQHQHLLGKYTLPILLIIISASIVQCGGEPGISSQVEFQFFPKRPIVIDTDFSFQAGNDSDDIKTATAPWFQFRYTIQNNSDKTITIANFKIIVTGKKDGQPTSSTEHSLDLESLGNEKASVTYLEEIAPGQSASESTKNLWVIDSLTKDVDNFNYTVKVEVQGWVGPANSPEHRLPLTFRFQTQ